MILQKIKYNFSNFIKPILRRLETLDINWGYALFSFVSVLAIVLLTGNIYRIIKRGYERYEIIQQEEERLAELELQNKELEDELKYYSSKEYIDIKAREEFNLVFPNQHLVYTVKEADFYESKPVVQIYEPPEPSWRVWKDLIF